MTIVEFLLARIAEDEERASFVKAQIEGQQWRPSEPWMLSWHDEYDLLCIEPERALAECEAKRRIVCRCDLILRGREHGMFSEGQAVDALDNSRALAAIYADHPDYDVAWRP